MKKKFLFLAALSCFTVLTACQKEAEIPQPSQSKAIIQNGYRVDKPYCHLVLNGWPNMEKYESRIYKVENGIETDIGRECYVKRVYTNSDGAEQYLSWSPQQIGGDNRLHVGFSRNNNFGQDYPSSFIQGIIEIYHGTKHVLTIPLVAEKELGDFLGSYPMYPWELE